MKEEIFDFDKHKGRRIKVLTNCPLGGKVKKGEIGVLKYGNVADFPSQSGYYCGGGNNFYERFELLPEDGVKEPQFEVGTRLEGDIFKVLEKFPEDKLYYAEYLVNNLPENWRLATPEEAETYKVEGNKKWLGYPYIVFDNTCANNGCHGGLRNNMENNAIEITIDQFNQYFGKKESVSKTEEFILPEKWCIKVTAENKKSLEDWRPMKSITGTGSYMLNDNFKGDFNSKGYVTQYYDKNYTEITFEQFKKYVLKETVTKVDLSKQEPMKTAVHVKTSEEFDFVISKIREKSNRYNSWNVYRTESCISSDFGYYQNKDWFSKNNYKVVSFEDWCEDNEYIFVTQELKEEELKVGDYAVVLKGYRGSNFTPGNIVKLVLDEKCGFQCLDVRTPYSENTHFIYTKNLRKATTQEILAETLPTVIGHIKNPFEITNAQENINILPKPKELEIVPISKYFKIRN